MHIFTRFKKRTKEIVLKNERNWIKELLRSNRSDEALLRTGVYDSPKDKEAAVRRCKAKLHARSWNHRPDSKRPLPHTRRNVETI
jgi:hypothetical protein